MIAENLCLYAVGDIGIHRDGPGQDPKSALAHVASTLRQADIGFCQLERTLSTRTGPVDDQRAHSRVSPNMVTALTSAGFDVVSFASNHAMDAGPDAFLDTIDLLKRNNLAVTGAGRNLTEARVPAIIERKGTRVAFLAYCSVMRPGYEATAERPGVVPLRARTFYQPIEWQPATPSDTVSFPEMEDLEAMEEDIRRVRPVADVVVVSHHWGIHFQHATIAMYQRWAGHAAINAGADIVLGHHPHILKGIEIYRGKVIIYSLGDFALDDSYELMMRLARNLQFGRLMDLYGWKPDPAYPGYGMPVDSRKSAVAKIAISGKRIGRVSLLPAYINRNAEPEIMPREDARFDQVTDYLAEITGSQGLNARFVVEGNEVVISA